MGDEEVPGAKEKLVRAKKRWAKTGRALTGITSDTKDRRPPGQRVTADWPVLDLGIQPNLQPEDWSLTVGGQVERALKWDWTALMAQPQVTLVNDIHCVTTWSRYDNQWSGVAMRTLLAAVKPLASAKFLMLRSYDGYSTNIPLEDVDRDDVMIAHAWQGRPLERAHGGPVRLVVPHLYFWKSAKWLRHITFMDQDQPGYWEVRGYHMRGDPWREERYG